MTPAIPPTSSSNGRWRVLICLLAVLLPAAAPKLPSTIPVATIAVRSGDPSPVPARVGARFGCRLVATPSGGQLFVDRLGSALFLKDAAGIRTIARAGSVPGGAAIASICEAAAGNDGSIAFRATLAEGGDAIFRMASAGAAPELLMRAGDKVTLRSGEATVALLSAPAVDGSGRVVTAADFQESASALLRFAPGAAPEILLQTGDLLAGGLLRRVPTGPASNAAGVIAFTAALTSGAEAVVNRAADGTETVLFLIPATGTPVHGTVAIAAPAINATGQVAFLWANSGVLRLQRIVAGLSETIAAPGSAAPGGGTFAEITDLPPAITPEGGVIFGAYRSDGRGGLYLYRAQPEVVAEEGGDAGSGNLFTTLDLYQPQAAPAVDPVGAVFFAAVDTLGSVLDTRAGSVLTTSVRAGDPLAEPARFVSFLEDPFPFQGAGPFLARNGNLLFDARITAGARGLFERDRDGGISARVMDGDPAPGGGHLDGNFLAFHSINSDGVIAFLGAAPDTPAGNSLALYYGGGSTGDLRRVIGFGDEVPGGTSPVSGFLPPSRVDEHGQVAIPVFLSDGSILLLGYDGTDLFRIAGPGDPLSDGTLVQTILTGSPFAGAILPPLLDDAGNVTYGVVNDADQTALYEAPLRAGGGASASRLIGEGDEVEGGELTPFDVQAFDRDAIGRLGFQATYNEDRQFATFLRESGPAGLVARRYDQVGELGAVLDVLPRLALAGDGRMVHETLLFDGTQALLLREPPLPTAGPARFRRVAPALEPVTTILAATGQPSPGGGTYLSFQIGSRTTGRLASDGRGLLATAALTSDGPQEIVLFQLDSNRAPSAVAGADFSAECAGPAGTQVTLDGTGSSDPDGDPLTYLWTGSFGTATGARPTVTLPLGAAAITLVVSDGLLESPPATVLATVRDTVAPTISVRAVPGRLWPPDGRLVGVFFPIVVSDRCDATPSVVLSGVTILDAKSSDPDNDIAGASIGTDDRFFSLRAKRSGGPGGRTYVATYEVRDDSGNTMTATASVLVPANHGK
jgi:hypothetical protein